MRSCHFGVQLLVYEAPRGACGLFFFFLLMHTMVCSRHTAPALKECGCLLGVNIQKKKKKHFCKVLSESTADALIPDECKAECMCTVLSVSDEQKKKKKKTFYHPCQWDSCSLSCSPLVGTSCRFIKRGELLVLMKSRAAAKK